MQTNGRMWNIDELEQRYYKWLVSLIPAWRDSHGTLLRQLYDTPFRVTMIQDENRVGDGLSLRGRFIGERHIDLSNRDALKQCRPCSVLEVMIAMALRCEEEYMTQYSEEDPISVWFGPMILSLGLAHCSGPFYDTEEADVAIRNFLNRAYQPDGLGGLFHVPGIQEDMRKLELWSQMMIWIDHIKGEQTWKTIL